MTDERMEGDLLATVRRLPCGTGVIFRHHGLLPAARRALFRRLQPIAAARGLMLLRAGADRLGPRETGEHGRHRARGCLGLRSVPVHDTAELRLARRLRPRLVIISPVRATRSHPGAPPLDRAAVRRLVGAAPAPVLLLGGMNARRLRAYRWRGIWGWAGIDAFSARQNRNAVPT